MSLRWDTPVRWSESARRRGGLAAAVFLVIGTDAYVDGWTWGWIHHVMGSDGSALIAVNIVHVLAMLPALILLGPGAVREVTGRRPTAASMIVAALLGLLGVAMFVGYGYFLAGQLLPGHVAPLPRATHVLLSLLSITVASPFMEEIVLRGLLWSALRRICSVPMTVVITATVFTCGHGPHRVAEFPCLFAYGIMLGLLRHRSNSLPTTMLAHSVTNLGITIATYRALIPW